MNASKRCATNFSRYTGAFVTDANGYVAVAAVDLDADRRRAVAPGVDQQVDEDLVDLVGVALDDGCALTGHHDRDVETQLRDRVPGRIGDVDGRACTGHLPGL